MPLILLNQNEFVLKFLNISLWSVLSWDVNIIKRQTVSLKLKWRIFSIVLVKVLVFRNILTVEINLPLDVKFLIFIYSFYFFIGDQKIKYPLVHCKHNQKNEPAFHFNYANIRLIQEHAYWVQRDVWLRRVMWSRSYITSQGSMIDMLWNMRQTQNRSLLIDTSIIWNLTIILVQNLTLNPFTHVKYTAVFINYFLRNHDKKSFWLWLLFLIVFAFRVLFSGCLSDDTCKAS